jgi:hypothetical protein
MRQVTPPEDGIRQENWAAEAMHQSILALIDKGQRQETHRYLGAFRGGG